jgi:hypothetical protein
MQTIDQVLHKMIQRADAWEKTGDQRCIFLRCYSMMSTNMATAITEGHFHDPKWISTLMLRFAEYYFEALDNYERHSTETSQAWQQVHDATAHSSLHVLQCLLLGVNAHINYDLPLSLYDCLREEWSILPPNQQQLRQEDHEKVNQVIASTIDAVQDAVIEPHAPVMAIVDRVMGRMDEWLLSQLISSWRNEVWSVATSLLDAVDPTEWERIRQQQEQRVLERGESLKGAL